MLREYLFVVWTSQTGTCFARIGMGIRRGRIRLTPLDESGIRCEIVGAFVNEKCVGYGVVYKPSGILMQLAVAQGFRGRGIGRSILAALSGDRILKTNNVDEELKGTLAFYKACGFEVVLRQFEMVKFL